MEFSRAKAEVSRPEDVILDLAHCWRKIQMNLRSGFTFVTTWAVVLFLLYKYVVLQFGLVNDHVPYLLVLGLLLCVSISLAGSETALSKIASPDLAQWDSDVEKEKNKFHLKLNQKTGLSRFFTPLEKLLFYLCYSCRTKFWVRRGQVDIQDRLSMIVTCNNIININMVILLAKCLTQSPVFLNGANISRHLVFFGGFTFLDKWLPLAGDAGFSSVGVTLILLIIAELIPKKIALHDPMGFLRSSTFLLIPLGWCRIPGIFAEGLAMPINVVCRKLGWPITE